MSEEKENIDNNNHQPSGQVLRQKQNKPQSVIAEESAANGKTVITNADFVIDNMQKSGPAQLPPERYNEPSPAEGFRKTQVFVTQDGQEI